MRQGNGFQPECSLFESLGVAGGGAGVPGDHREGAGCLWSSWPSPPSSGDMAAISLLCGKLKEPLEEWHKHWGE